MIKLNYGKYAIPKKLNQIIELQQHLNDTGQLKYGDILGYYFSYENIDARYLNTPLDVIPFARPGTDGIHFGFLTDFGQVEDLHDAYIVRVSPMDFDAPVHIVARNIEDFIRNICFYPNAMDMLDITSKNNEVLDFLNQHPMLQKEMILNSNEYKIQRIVCDMFQLNPIENFENYFHLIHQQRTLETIRPTIDLIGIVKKDYDSEESLNNAGLFNVENRDQLTISEVKAFFETATYVAKLVFLRETQSKGLLWGNEDIKAFLKEQLRLMQLLDEAERICYP